MKLPRVIHLPFINSPYQLLLVKHLNKCQQDAYHAKMLNFAWVNLTLPYNLFTGNNFDIIHLHWQHSFLLSKTPFQTKVKAILTIFQFRLLQLFGKKIIWTIHNINHHENIHKDIELTFSKKLARLADGIIVHCPSARSYVQEAYELSNNSKIWVVPHANFIGYYPNDISKSAARKILKLSINDKVFLFFGMIRRYKGILDLINNYKKLNNAKSKLLIIGKPNDNTYSQQIKKEANGCKNIHLTFDFINDEKIQTYMNAADIIVLPYRDILSTGALLLALSFGKPIIAPKIGCIPDVVTDQGGFLYDPSEPDGLLNAMNTALSTKADLERISNFNMQLANKLEWCHAAELTVDVYRSVY